MKSEYMYHSGSDLDNANAARVSFAKASTLDDNGNLRQGDINLINFLARGYKQDDWDDLINLVAEGAEHNAEEVIKNLKRHAEHWTPFTHNSITLRMAAPVPIRVQCFKHKVGFTENEESRRYISSRPEYYVPEFRSKPEGSIKQGSGGIHPQNEMWKKGYIIYLENSIQMYEDMIFDGIAPEQARFVLPQGVIVNWIWTGSLASYCRYYNQRSDPHAQMESQILAEKVKEIIRPLFPVSWDALCG